MRFRIKIYLLLVLGWGWLGSGVGFGQVASYTVCRGDTFTVNCSDLGKNTGCFASGSLNVKFNTIAVSAINPAPSTVEVVLPMSIGPGVGALGFVKGGMNSWTDTIYVEILDPSISYSNSQFCQNGNPESVTISGPPNSGTFSSLNGFLSINSTTGLITPNTSQVGLGEVQFVSSGLGCIDSFSVEILPVPVLSFVYDSSLVCSDHDTLAAAVNSVPGNFFYLSSPFGTQLDLNSGDLSNFSGAGGKVIEVGYSLMGAASCGVAVYSSVAVIPRDDASFEYPDTLCRDALPTGVVAVGAFSFTTPAFPPPSTILNLDQNTGEIDFDSSRGGPFIVTFQTNGLCPNQSSQQVTIGSVPSPAFTIDSTYLCSRGGGVNLTSTSSSAPSHFYSDSLFVNSSTVTLDTALNSVYVLVSGSTGVHTITNITDAYCPDTATAQIFLYSPPLIGISYQDTSFCEADSLLFPTVIGGASNGVFSLGQGDALDLDIGTGLIGTGSLGINHVLYTIEDGYCTVVDSVQIQIEETEDASFSYPPDTLCQGDSSLAAMAVNSGGFYFANEFGLSVNSQTGVIVTDSLTPADSVWVYYQSPGTCPGLDTQMVEVFFQPDASFHYTDSIYCVTNDDPVAIPDGSPWGIYSLLDVCTNCLKDSMTGELDLYLVNSKGYLSDTFPLRVQRSFSGTCPDSDTVVVSVGSVEDAAFGYGASLFCSSLDSIFIDSIYPTGGVFSSNSSIFTVDSLKGTIIPNANTVFGTDTIQRNTGTSGDCSDFASLEITLQAPIELEFEYDSLILCSKDVEIAKPILTSVGSTHEGYQSVYVNATLIDTTYLVGIFNGWVVPDFGLETDAHLSIEHTLETVCSEKDTAYVDVIVTPNPDFLLNSYFYCPYDTIALFLTPVPDTGGVFWVRSGDNQLLMDSISDLTQIMDSLTGAMFLEYEFREGCKTSHTEALEVFGLLNPQVDVFPNDSVCEGEGLRVDGVGGLGTTIILGQDTVLETTSAFFTYATDSLTQNSLLETEWFYGNFAHHCSLRLDIPIHVSPTPQITGDTAFHEQYQSQTAPPEVKFLIDQYPAYAEWYITDTVFVQFDEVEIDTIGPNTAVADTVFLFGPEYTFAAPYSSGIFDMNLAPYTIARPGKRCYGDTLNFEMFLLNLAENIFIPELMTPNNDQHNDNWEIKYQSDFVLDDFEIFLYNRSGGEVLHMYPVNDAWGSDTKLVDGVYWWVLKNRTTGYAAKTGGLTIARGNGLSP